MSKNSSGLNSKQKPLSPRLLGSRKTLAFFLPAIVTVLMGITLQSCAPYHAIDATEQQLALSGFTAHRADTTARLESMNILPPNQLTYRPTYNGIEYLYADPVFCGCVYMGSANSYASYHRSIFSSSRKSGDRADPAKSMQAENNRHPGWDWSVWAPNADPGPTRPIHAGGDTL